MGPGIPISGGDGDGIPGPGGPGRKTGVCSMPPPGVGRVLGGLGRGMSGPGLGAGGITQYCVRFGAPFTPEIRAVTQEFGGAGALFGMKPVTVPPAARHAWRFGSCVLGPWPAMNPSMMGLRIQPGPGTIEGPGISGTTLAQPAHLSAPGLRCGATFHESARTARCARYRAPTAPHTVRFDSPGSSAPGRRARSAHCARREGLHGEGLIPQA